jgi:hypothetical protein
MRLRRIKILTSGPKILRMDWCRNSLLGWFGTITWTILPSFPIKIVRQEFFANAAGQSCTITLIKFGVTRWRQSVRSNGEKLFCTGECGAQADHTPKNDIQDQRAGIR